MKTAKILATTLATLLLAGCAEEVASPATEHRELTFAVSIADGGGDVSISRSVAYDEAEQNVLMQGKGSQQLYVHTMVEPRTTVKGTTRATLLYGETFPVDRTLGVSGYRYSQATQLSTTMPNFYYNAAVNYSGAKWVSNKAYYIPANDEQLAFYAYWPYDASAAMLSSSTASGPLTISYTVNTTDITAQEDLMTACVTGLSYRSSPDYRVPLVFRHALAAIRIELGEDVAPGYVRKVSLLNVCLSGTHTIGGGWTPTNKGNVEVDFTNGDTTNGYDTNSQMGVATILDGEKTLLMIPQVFAADDENACLYFEINDGTLTHGLYYHLNGQSWEAGTVTTYRIDTHSINTARLAEVEYPADWGGETFSLKNAYAANDTVGLYAVDGNEVKAANVAYAYNGTSWQPISSTALPYSKDYTYYAYYPYRKNVAGGHAVGDKVTADDTADNFFGSLVSSWAVSTDQSTAEKLLANDLQLGKATKSTTQRSTITLGMQHKMGLAGLNLNGKTATGTVNYYLSTDPDYTWSATQTETVLASSLVEGKQLCPKADNWYYYVTKAGQKTDFKCQKNNDNSDWAQDYSLTIGSGQYDSFTADINIPSGVIATHSWVLKAGDVYFSDGSLGTTTTSYGTSKTAVGIVLSTSTSTLDTGAGFKHGYVVSAKNVGGPNNGYKWGANNNTNTGNGYVATDNQYSSVQADLDGRTKNNRIKALSNYTSANYTAVYQALNFNVPLSGTSSGWFLPTLGMFDLWIRTTSVDANGNNIMGSFAVYNTSGGGGFYFSGSVSAITSNMNTYFTNRGFVDGSTFHRIAWSSSGGYAFWMVSESNITTPYFVDFYKSRLNYPRDIKRANTSLRLRPFLVF